MTPRGRAALSVGTTTKFGEPCDVVAEDLVQFVAAAGLQPLVVPNCPDLAPMFVEQAAVVVLSGGSEVVPEPAAFDVGRRQRTERALIDAAVERGVPLLGLCRGMQVINSYFGGTLRLLPERQSHVAIEHGVELVSSRLTDALGGTETLTVNSYHHDAIAVLGEGLGVVGIADDGEIEAIEHCELNVAGLMWHPERACSDASFERAHRQFLRRLTSSHEVVR